MHRIGVVVLMLVSACAEDAQANPRVQSAEVSRDASCATNERLVTDACTELGPDDGCVDVDDVCIALCDERSSCAITGGLRATSPWPVAPNGYCVECDVP